ncbi:MAG: helicase-related protein [Erysipelotrichaceae bacterium]|nr:helicase-related protein [Erysipelotrichaceae bacterium]
MIKFAWVMKMRCPQCHNDDPLYFYSLDGRYYCRKCISFQRVFVDEILETKHKSDNRQVDYHLDFDLTPAQKNLSARLLTNYKNGQNSQVKAVCGAGKTEIVYEVIKSALNDNDRVCFTTPRKELIKELGARIQRDFSNIEVTLVYGGHCDNVAGPFIICTTHQLYRYHQTFDLMIIDEVDAFPFAGNDLLSSLFFQAIKGSYIMMSATNARCDFQLNARFHGHPLPVPKCLCLPGLIAAAMMVKDILAWKSKSKPALIFVPTIARTASIKRLLALFKIKCEIAHSKIPDVEKLIGNLKAHRYDCIVTTTLLERGITIANVQVLVIEGDHPTYSLETLIQICGRVGRKKEYPGGEVKIYARRQTKEIRQCIQAIKKANA